MHKQILLVDDHPMILEGLKTIIGEQSGLRVTGSANCGEQLLAMLEKQKPDLIVSDLALPDIDGLSLWKKIQKIASDVKFLLITMHKERGYVHEALLANVDGYVLKNEAGECIVEAINRIFAGKKYYSRYIEELMMEEFGSLVRNNRSQSVLSNREQEVLSWVAKGYSSKDIADQLCISLRTVDFHRSNINSKLGTNKISELTKYALREGMI